MNSVKSAAICFASTGFLLAFAAQAHPQLVSSTPAANAVASKVQTVELHFSEKLVGQFSGVDLLMIDMPGMKMAEPMKMGDLTSTLSADGKTLIVTSKEPLPAGTYDVTWHAVTSDTHRVEGTYKFEVR